MTLREKIQTMEAFERGEEIEEVYRGYGTWSSVSTPSWNFEDRNYRIKPKPKQVVVIEKWLYKYDKFQFIVETDNIENYIREFSGEKIKLLDTYEVEI